MHSWEIAFILTIVVIVFGEKHLPTLKRGLLQGFREFWKSLGCVFSEVDSTAIDAGKSLGGIYGKPAAQALTVDNKTAELYDPEAFRKSAKKRFFSSVFLKIFLIAVVIAAFATTVFYLSAKL